ncbi:inosine triphosphate pyrophosphatase-like protein [Pseudomassariella vexata]|uniref:Inosine triphosphate pyrophosphatase-like protein n=1 Tax=Pseudomassariella vexata TaxID=1141098 RepID=A0A1Y2DEX1_9PEZI|nr:inosine triphosphate pyrophosphatase-like protein [Pseudomassariella vexata]ORY57215.1 inosine triphosphate pyrophosphatase-like protein [Pseudomassariella vexata]
MDEKTPLVSEKETPPNYPPLDYITAAREHGLPIRQSGPIRKGPQPIELPILAYMKSHRVILASASPRRKALLAQVGLTNLEILPSTKPENLPKTDFGDPFEYVRATARQKCLDIYAQAIKENENDKSKGDPDVVIAADTVIVTRAGQILEKPRSETDHIRMLKLLRDTRVHRVLTAVCCMAPKADASHPGYEIDSLVEETKVFFAQETDGLPDDVITSYVRTREGVDKAGGYAVQGIAGLVMVEKVDGSVDNVVGLPVRKCLQLCEKVVFRQGQESGGESEGEEEF